MKLFVTGATGFLGRYVVAEALRREHSVHAVARRSADLSDFDWSGNVELARVDLRSREGLVDSLRGCDAVIHLAAAKSGDIYAQLASTVVGTENLLWAMNEAGASHIILTSSFAVYEYLHRRSFSTHDENSPLDLAMIDRDDYAKTKLIQEQLVIDHAKSHDWRWTVLRPGMIYGKDVLFNARVGMKAGARWWIRTGAWAQIPLNYVENCAEAIVLAAEVPAASGEVLNVVDDHPPTQRRYSRLIQERSTPRPRILPVSWTLMRSVARLAWLTNKLLLGGRAKLPGLLVPAKMHARNKALRYSNEKIKRVLGWRPRYGLVEAIDRSVASATPTKPVPTVPNTTAANVKLERATA
jgi:nucleoside-diphosphate-sugar epimerase